MQVIPVIDLLNGVVVHAKKGQRADYAPIESRLTSSSEPIAIIEALLNIYPFDTFYIADLNSIQKQSPHALHADLIKTLKAKFSETCFWVDAGTHMHSDFRYWQQSGISPIIASENCYDLLSYQALVDDKNTILSLDFRGDAFMGHSEILKQTQTWPETVIVMTLARVGAQAGPDLEKLTLIRQQHQRSNVIAAGGVRNLEDLKTLRAHNIQGALVATALHSGDLNADDLNTLKGY